MVWVHPERQTAKSFRQVMLTHVQGQFDIVTVKKLESFFLFQSENMRRPWAGRAAKAVIGLSFLALVEVNSVQLTNKMRPGLKKTFFARRGGRIVFRQIFFDFPADFVFENLSELCKVSHVFLIGWDLEKLERT